MNELRVDEYLKKLPDDQRAVLENIRKTIKALSPEITELISYGIPSFKYKGRQFAAFPTHCNFLLMSYPLMETSKQARMAEIDTTLRRKKPTKSKR